MRDIVKLFGDDMIRTIVKREARAAGISVAEYVRRAIRQVLPTRTDAPWMRYAGFVESGNSLSSQTIDDIVYGSKG
jgi:hypothetical protein